MIHVIATIRFAPKRRQELVKIYQELVPDVLKENGCIEYTPTSDFDLGLPNQEKDEARFQVIEKWQNEAAFRAHLQQPHVIEFRKQIQGIVEGVSVQILSGILDK